MATTGNYTPDSTHKHFQYGGNVMDDFSSDSGIFCDSKMYHSYFRYNISFIDPPLGGFGEIFPSVMIFQYHHFRKYFAESPERRVYK